MRNLCRTMIPNSVLITSGNDLGSLLGSTIYHLTSVANLDHVCNSSSENCKMRNAFD